MELFFCQDGSKNVSVRVTTNTIRIKLQEDGTVLYEFPVLRMSYCGVDKGKKNAISFVAKESGIIVVAYTGVNGNQLCLSIVKITDLISSSM